MWLLDANLDIHLAGLFRSYEIDCDTAENRGWKALRNGDLVADSLLTRDQLFAESASRIWRLYPKFAWAVQPIQPVPGEIVNWP